MRKIFWALLPVLGLIGCSPSDNGSQTAGNTPSTAKWDRTLTPEQEVEQHIYDLRMEFEKRDSNKDSLREVYDRYLREMSIKYQGDSIGLLLVKTMAEDYSKHELDSVMALCDLYSNDAKLQRLARISAAAENTAVGQRYVDFSGLNTKTEKMFRLSSVVGQGKPVLVNFWSSWSIPSRDVIRDEIFECAGLYRDKVNFLSVAVWEDSVTFVNRAVSELQMEWIVMYTEGREQSPVDLYGISGVPYVLLIGKNGIIQARNLQKEEIKPAIEKIIRNQE